MTPVNSFFQPSWPKDTPKLEEPAEETWLSSAARTMFSVVFFPYGLYQLAAAGINKLAAISLYPSPITAYFEKTSRKEMKKFLKTHHDGETIPLKTPDGCSIDNMLFRGNEKKAVIYCTGRGGFFESKANFEYIYDITKRVGDINLFLLNPRGVGDSEGTPSPRGMALDVYSTFKYLVEKEGFSPDDIVIYGYSLGGGYGALGAELVQKEFPDAKINFLSERSFCNLEEQVKHMVLQKLASYPRIAKILSDIAVCLLHSCKWPIDSERAIKTLKGNVCIVYNKIDDTIPFVSSLYRRMKQSAQEGQLEKPIRCVKLLPIEGSPSSTPHARQLTPWEKYEVANELKRMLHMEHEEPIDLKHIKEIGAPEPSRYKGANREFYHAAHAIKRLEQILQQTPEDPKILADRLMMIFYGLQRQKILLHHFQQQEIALKRLEDPMTVNLNPEGVKDFYLRVLARARISLIVDQLEKKAREGRFGDEERSLLHKLEQIPLLPEDADALGTTNLAHRLFYEFYSAHEAFRSSGIAWPAPDSPEFGRQGFHGEVFVPNLVRIKAIENLKARLVEAGWSA
ncbi:MAG: hypothetical protein JSR39_08175 [Verrucomicrobia bacterium]|nr:hypothetical protein [Verrucomicrobiota bacterium]